MIDLHCHSTFSDGDYMPNELLKKAEELKLECFSITDHNNCFAYENINVNSFSGKLINGIEIVTSFERHIIEILGYGMKIENINKWAREQIKKEKDYTMEIFYTLKDIFEINGIYYNKNINIEEIIQKEDPTGCLKEYIYIDLLKNKKNVDIIGKEILNSYADFNKKGLNNPNSLLFINEYTRFPTIEEVVDLIHNNGGLCFLAHIYQYNVNNHIEFLDRIRRVVKLDGIETYHSSFSEKQICQINEYAQKNGLYKSGGSDYHGRLKPNIIFGLNNTIPKEIIEPWINKY